VCVSAGGGGGVNSVAPRAQRAVPRPLHQSESRQSTSVNVSSRSSPHKMAATEARSSQVIHFTSAKCSFTPLLLLVGPSCLLDITSMIFTARRYASAVFSVIVCPSVCPCVHHKPVCIEMTGRIELVFGMDAYFQLSHAVLLRILGTCISQN